jgi:hypothetical protein
MDVEPFRVAAEVYRRAEWLGVIPLPAKCKASPPAGWTGHDGGWPSGADIQSWLEDCEAASNIALRLPPDVLGIDVDAYGDKQGAETFRHCRELWGPLPPTWRSTSREAGQGSILLFRIPEGLAWPGEIGPGIELIQYGHRYMVAPPSVHPEGRQYHWGRPPGMENVKVPRPEDLPYLPDTWVHGITAGMRAGEHRVAGFTSGEVNRWLLSHGQGEPCPLMQRTLETYEVRFAAGGSRHEAARDAVRRITGLAVDGHPGMTAALDHTARVFRQVTRNDKTRPVDPNEWRRLLDGAVQLAGAEEASTVDPCSVPVRMPTPAAAVAPFPTGLLENVRNGAWLSRQTFPPLRHAIDGLIPEGYSLLVGAPKIGKSFLVLDLALAKSSGGRALGRLPVTTGPVLYLALEDGDRRMQSRARMLRGDVPLPAEFEYIVKVSPTTVMDVIEEWLSMHGDEQPLVILDTLGKVMPPSANGETTYQRDYRVGSQLKAMIDAAAGGSLVVNHHDRKAMSSDFVDAVSGTHGLAGAADTTIVVTRDRLSEDGLVRVTGRDVREGQYALTFSEGAWVLVGDTLDAAQEAAASRAAEARSSSDRTREVVQYVTTHPGCGAADVEQALDMSQARTYLMRLVGRGLIARLSTGRYGPIVPQLTVITDSDVSPNGKSESATPSATPAAGVADVTPGQNAFATPATPATHPPSPNGRGGNDPSGVAGVAGVAERLPSAETPATPDSSGVAAVADHETVTCTLCDRSEAVVIFPEGPRCPEHYP